jgi:hypothetical protein
LIANAIILKAPNAKDVKGWKQVVSLGQKTTVNYPATSVIGSNDLQSLTLEVPTSTTAQNGEDPRWFALMPYNATRELELSQAFVTSTNVSYLVDDHLLLGKKGILAGQKNPVVVLRVRAGGQTTHLLWAHDPAGRSDNAMLMNVLATLDFAN